MAWAPPGREANSARWRYDMRKGYVQPGMSADPHGTQYELPEGFDPATAPKGFHLVVSPPGTSAPIGEINYTPDTNEVHDRGQLAPVDKTNYSLVSSGRRGWTAPAARGVASQGWSAPTPTAPPTGGVGVGQDAMHYPGEPPNSVGSQAPQQTPQQTPQAPTGDMVQGTNNPGTGFWFRGFGAGSDANGNDPGDPGYDPSSEDDPYATWSDGSYVMDNPSGPQAPQAPAATAPQPQAPAAVAAPQASAAVDPTINPQGGVGASPEGPTLSGVPPNYTGRIGNIQYVNGKQAGYFTQGPDPTDSTLTKDTYHASPEKPPANPTSATETWTNTGGVRSDGSQVQTNTTTGESRVVPGPRKDPASTDPNKGYPKTQFVNGQWWQIDAPGSKPHVVADDANARTTAADQHWTTEPVPRADGSYLQTNDSTGQTRVVPAPKQPRQFYTSGNNIVQVDPNDPNGKGHVVYTAPGNLTLQTLGDGTIVGIDPITGRTQTIMSDPTAAAQSRATLAQSGATLAQTQATTRQQDAATLSNQESSRATQMGEIPQVSYAGGNIIVPYGAEADMTYWNPLTGETSQQNLGHQMALPDIQRAYGITPAGDTQQAAPPPPPAAAPATTPTPAAPGPMVDSGSPPPPDPSPFTQSDIPEGSDRNRSPFTQSDQPEGSSRGNVNIDPSDDTGAGASDMQTDLRKNIPNWRGMAGGSKAKQWKGLGSKFLGRGLDDFTPFVGLGQDEKDYPPPYNTKDYGRPYGGPSNPEVRSGWSGGLDLPPDFQSGDPIRPYTPTMQFDSDIRNTQDVSQPGGNTGMPGPSIPMPTGTPWSPTPQMPPAINTGIPNPMPTNTGARGPSVGIPDVVSSDLGTGAGAGPMPPAGAKWTPPLHAQDVVGTGHKFGDKLKSGEPWHKGTDLQAVHGTSTQSPVDGMVVQIDNNPRGLGLSVVILDEQGKEHKLSHLSKALVKNGDHVRAGQEVGKVGSTGNTTGAHLDYRIQKPDGQYENPEPKMPQLSGMPPAPGTEMMTDTGAGQGGMPDMGGGASNSAAPQMPSAGGGPPSSPPAGGGPDMNDPRMAMLLQMIMQALGKSGGMPGGGSTPPPAPPSPSGGAPSLAPPGGMGMGAGADAKEMGVGAGGMRLANGNWSDALADTPQNQSKYGQGSGFSGNVGYSGSSSSAPKNQGGTGVAISPADQARLQLDTQVAQNNLNIQKQQNAQAQQNENDRHNEALQQLQQQAQQEADYKAIQDAVNAENVRHDQATEQLTQKQQALDLQLEQMKEQFTAGQTGVQNAMATMQSALNAPWLQGLLGLGVNPGSNAGPAIPGASNPWTNLLNIIFGGGGAPGGTQQGLNPLAATGAATQAAGTPAAGNTAAGPALPSAQQWAQMNPAQKAALQASVMAEGPGAWQSFQSSFQNQNGPQAPDMTQLQSALQTPEDQLGTQMNAEMFGEGAPAFQQRQQNTWVGANAPSVQQTLLQGTGFGQDEAHPKRGRVPAGKGSGKWSSQNRKRGWSGKRPRSAGMAV